MEDDTLQVPILERKEEGRDSIIIFQEESEAECGLGKRLWVESKKLWRIAGPAIFTRLTTYGTNLVTQAFVGHLGDLDLAAITISTTVIIGLSFGLLVVNIVQMLKKPRMGVTKAKDDRTMTTIFVI